MAEPKTETSGKLMGDEKPVGQPTDAVPMENIEAGSSLSAMKPETSDAEPIDTAALPPSSSKGKEKEIAPAAVEKNSGHDSLSIEPTDAEPSGSPDNPVCNITLLLPTGARHPYRIDEKYLSKRNVEVPDLTEAGHRDPFSISVYTLKELILREWRDEWDAKPASPSSIRLIHFGKLLDDKEQLKSRQSHPLSLPLVS
jgi:hypothetical protein